MAIGLPNRIGAMRVMVDNNIKFLCCCQLWRCVEQEKEGKEVVVM
jgi:hypothetical protein